MILMKRRKTRNWTRLMCNEKWYWLILMIEILLLLILLLIWILLWMIILIIINDKPMCVLLLVAIINEYY